MKLVIQRVSHASVKVNSQIVGEINKGYMCLVGIGQDDEEKDLEWILSKLLKIRLFPDAADRVNLSIEDVKGELLLVSQFTLMASCKKGTRPSFGPAMEPFRAEEFYNKTISRLRNLTHLKVATGVFGADMKVSLENDGPVTIILDSTNPS